MSTPLIAADALHARLEDVVVADVRWKLGDPNAGRAAWQAARIPGAVFVDLDTVLADLSDPRGGRHPLPDPQRCADALAALGIGPGRTVVAYDDAFGAVAARLWWTLGWLGGPPCLVLDGGLAAWTDAGLPVQTTPPPAPIPVPTWTARPDAGRVATADDAARAGNGVVLLDARTADRYAGEHEPVDPAAGHVPGARNAPWPDNLVGGRMADPAALRARYAALGVTADADVVAMCGSGVTACHDLLALAHAGLAPARLYVGSWSGWCHDGTRAVATGRDVPRPAADR